MKSLTDLANSLELSQMELRVSKKRVQELEMALARMVCAHENTQADSEGHWPRPDMGCPYCTQGTVPDALNTGPCSYHNARKLLGIPDDVNPSPGQT